MILHCLLFIVVFFACNGRDNVLKIIAIIVIVCCCLLNGYYMYVIQTNQRAVLWWWGFEWLFVFRLILLGNWFVFVICVSTLMSLWTTLYLNKSIVEHHFLSFSFGPFIIYPLMLAPLFWCIPFQWLFTFTTVICIYFLLLAIWKADFVHILLLSLVIIDCCCERKIHTYITGFHTGGGGALGFPLPEFSKINLLTILLRQQ